MTNSLATHWFCKGNIIYNSYWRSYDQVISSDGFTHTVVSVDKRGNVIGEPRTHCTHPSDDDAIMEIIDFGDGSFDIITLATWYEFRTDTDYAMSKVYR